MHVFLTPWLRIPFLRKVRIYGVGFLSVPGAVILRFTGVNGKSMEVQGTILDDEVVECSTPKAWDFSEKNWEQRKNVDLM